MKLYWMNLFFTISTLILTFSSCNETGVIRNLKEDHFANTANTDNATPSLDFMKTKEKAREAREFCVSQNFNTSFCILIDMSLHSGVNRFVVWDFERDTIEQICLVGHGSGDNPWNNDFSKENPRFSNEVNSHCSSLGKYRIGVAAQGGRFRYLSKQGLAANLDIANNDESNIRKFFHGRFDLLPEDPTMLLYSTQRFGLDFSQVERLFEITELAGEGYLAFTLGTEDALVSQFTRALEKVKSGSAYRDLLLKYGL